VGDDDAFEAQCGAADQGLREAAARVAARKLEGGDATDPERLVGALRAAGEPHPWPHAWVASVPVGGARGLDTQLGTWRSSFGGVGVRRCGVARVAGKDGATTIVAMAVDALADLAPLPMRARAGEWLEVKARMLVPATAARVLVLGPSGRPRTVPAAFDGTTLTARFAPDRPGAFLVQVVADVEQGPRPVLEARVFADVEPSQELDGGPASGEDAAAGAKDPADALARMVDAARAESALPPLARDRDLDALALAHVRAMLRARSVGHDVGDGDPASRVRAAGLDLRAAGENVARADGVRTAHRILWQSPSHRANVLGDFDRVGVAVVEDEGGTVWVCELFGKR
jgi:uncharacterized protein YkwD